METTYFSARVNKLSLMREISSPSRGIEHCYFFQAIRIIYWGRLPLSAGSRNFTCVPWVQVAIADITYKQVIGSGLNPRNEMNTFKSWYTHDLFTHQQVPPSWEPFPNSPSLLSLRPLKFKDFLVHLSAFIHHHQSRGPIHWPLCIGQNAGRK